MSTESIVALLIEGATVLDGAPEILGGAASGPRRSRRPGKKLAEPTSTEVSAEPTKPARRKRRKLSAEARGHIAAAQKKRWAEFRKEIVHRNSPHDLLTISPPKVDDEKVPGRHGRLQAASRKIMQTESALACWSCASQPPETVQ